MHDLGLSPRDIDDTPAARLDWLLAVHDVHLKVRAEAEGVAP